MRDTRLRRRPRSPDPPGSGRSPGGEAPLPSFGAGGVSERLVEAGRRLGDAFAAEFADGAGLAWLVVAFALGAALYAVLPDEPMLPALVVAAVGSGLGCLFRRRSGHDARLLAVVAALAIGATLAKLESDRVAAPRLDRERTVTVAGWVADAEATVRNGRRLVVRVATVEARGLAAANLPRLITVTARGAGRDAAVGSPIRFLARLRPPDGPTLPGGYDFARRAWFEGRGGSGFVLGKVTPADLGPAPWPIRLGAPLANLRADIAERVRRTLPGATGAIAAALMVGEARAIPDAANDALRASGLYHIISISGLHMTLVAGGVFSVLRLVLALLPGIALRHDTKKLAAVFAVVAAGFYLLLSGAAVATVRSFIMFAVGLLAVLTDRAAVTRATVAVSAAIVVALWPSSVIEPGFLMSFLAVAALVATFEVWQARPAGDAKTIGWPRRLARGAGLWLAGAALTSLVAGLATLPIVVDAFHRSAPYGVLANLAALPIVGFVIMPMAVVAALAMPFGLDGPPLALMGIGVDAMVEVAVRVAGLPGGDGLVGRIHPLAAPIAVAGILWLVIWRGRIRLVGLVPVALAVAIAPFAVRPDILVADDGRTVAVRGADGRLTVTGAKDNVFAVETWLAADADPRAARATGLADGWRCDPTGCEAEVGRPAGGAPGAATVIVGGRAADLPEDCRRAVVVVSDRVVPPACAETALLLDRAELAGVGSVAIDLSTRAIRAAHLVRRPWTAGSPAPRPLVWPAPPEAAATRPAIVDPTDPPDDEAAPDAAARDAADADIDADRDAGAGAGAGAATVSRERP
jgi:competence protein ComEC